MFYSDDPVRDAERYLDYLDKELAKRPVCCECGEHIQEERAYYINGEMICQECMGNYLVQVEEYME